MATKKKELLEQEAPVTETVMSEGETLPADTAQPECALQTSPPSIKSLLPMWAPGSPAPWKNFAMTLTF